MPKMKKNPKTQNPSKGTVWAAKARARTNQSTREDHETAVERALSIIYGNPGNHAVIANSR
jgi:hypothetical protein